MKYALLIYSRQGSHEELPEAEQAAVFEEYMALTREPACVATGRLQPTHTATTVRVDDGRTLTTDGPFADTKEFLGGYYIVDVDDLDKAIELAARIPAARLGGGIEVRPINEG